MITRNVLTQMGGNASIIKTNSNYQAIAVTTDCNIFYCDNNSYEGALQAVAESYRNLISVGSKPLALTNCLNFGNPENQKIMGQFVDSIKGINVASKKLNMPIVSGNVSFYNETNSTNIPPTPQIGAVGVINDYRKTVSYNSYDLDDVVYLIGKPGNHLSCSAYERCFYKFDDINKTSLAPKVDLNTEIINANFIKKIINKKVITACHDISDGGLLIAILEMCLSKNKSLHFDKSFISHSFLFGEDQSRYIITVSKDKIPQLKEYIEDFKIHSTKIGRITDDNKIIFSDKSFINIDELKKRNKL
jgi:phosphoribosylformylglycinamidine synthase